MAEHQPFLTPSFDSTCAFYQVTPRVANIFWGLLLIFFISKPVSGAGTGETPLETVVFPAQPTEGISGASVTFRMPASTVKSGKPLAGIMALLPGCNGNAIAAYLSKDSPWPAFADRFNLVIAATSFVSPEAELMSERGYYRADQCSGRLLIEAISRWQVDDAKRRDIPLYLFGFSGGAHFVHHFVLWKPERVAGFVVYSAGWWSEPTLAAAHVPGFVLCGYQDDRFDATLDFFKGGRRLDALWCFARVRYTAHVVAPNAVDLAQAWLASLLLRSETEPHLVGSSTAGESRADEAKFGWSGNLYTNEIWQETPQLSIIKPRVTSVVRFPDKKFAMEWQRFNLDQAQSAK